MTALAICFGLNALSFLAVILSLMSLHIKHMPAARTHNMFGELKQGLAYVHEQRSIMALMVLGAATTFFGIPMLTLLPVFARDVFGSGVEGYSALLAFSGAGAVVGRDGGGLARPLSAHGADDPARAGLLRRADRAARVQPVALPHLSAAVRERRRR